MALAAHKKLELSAVFAYCVLFDLLLSDMTSWSECFGNSFTLEMQAMASNEHQPLGRCSQSAHWRLNEMNSFSRLYFCMDCVLKHTHWLRSNISGDHSVICSSLYPSLHLSFLQACEQAQTGLHRWVVEWETERQREGIWENTPWPVLKSALRLFVCFWEGLTI